MRYGAQSAVAPLRKALLRRPDWNLEDEPWEEKWGYDGRPDLEAARREHDAFASLLGDLGVQVYYLEGDGPELCDSVYIYDRAVITSRGGVVLRSGKPARFGESRLMAEGLRDLGIPILYEMRNPMTADGGDFLWLREDLVLVGRSYRTNAVCHPEFIDLFSSLGVQVRPAPIPHWTGAGDVMHLTSFISLVDHDLAVAYRKIMAVETVEFLVEQGVEFIDVSDEEFDTGLGANVLAVAPRKCVMLQDYPGVRADLEAAGAEVHVFDGRELSHRMKGGATCMTLPILRE